MKDVLLATAGTATARKRSRAISELSTPRDRHSTFEAQIIYLRRDILSLYTKGMITRDIQATLQDLYHVVNVVNEEVVP